MAAILQVVGLVLQMFLIFFKLWMKGTVEEKLRLQERLKNIAALLKKAAEDKSESINEADYISNLNWEQKTRYEAYKKEVTSVLLSGSGIDGLKSVTTMGMGLRVDLKISEVVQILLKEVSDEDKSVMLAKELANF